MGIRVAAERIAGAGARARGRIVADAGPILQGTAAATAAWVIARYVLDHPQPFFAPIAAVVALNTSLGERGRNALRLLQGVIVGIGVGELTLLSLGGGYGSIALATLIAMAAARAIDGSRLVIAQSAVGAILVVAIADADAGIDRLVDAFVGAGIALVFTQLLFSPEPVALLRRAEIAALTAMAEGLELAARALSLADDELADKAIGRLRDLRDDLAELGRVRHASARVARRTLIWRSRRTPVVRESENADHLDLLGGSCLLLARAAASLGASERATIEPSVRELADTLRTLATALDDRSARQLAADRSLRAAAEVVGSGTTPDSPLGVAIVAVRVAATDLMVFAGVDFDDAVEAIRAGILERSVPAPEPTRRFPFGLFRRRRR